MKANRRRFLLDVESTSTVDLQKAGAAAYWEHPDTRIICAVYRVDDGPPVCWRPGDPIPYFVPELDHAWRVVAHNYLFEYWAWMHVLRPKFGWALPRLEYWDCTMARSLYWGLPPSLDEVTRALGLPVVKDASARPLMLRMARPRSEFPELTWWHETDPDKLRALEEYCAQDVLAECCLDDALPDLPDRERMIFLADARINLRGMAVDVDMVTRLWRLTREEQQRLNARAVALTDGRINSTNKVPLLLEELNRLDVPLPNLTKDTVGTALTDPAIDGLARELLLLRQEAAKASTAKLTAMLAGRSPDNRCRGLYQYAGAGRTLRWAARRVQTQNMPRGTLKELGSVFGMVSADASAEDLDMLLPGTVMDAIASLLRGCIVPGRGKVFVVVDLAQIEARVIAWLAGQTDILLVFAAGQDVYVYTAKQIGSANRQLGKVLVLACVGHGTLVLTDTGWKPIQDVTTADLVWDGVEWVRHQGIVERGPRETLSVSGAWLTPDHRILCGTRWLPAQSVAHDASTLSLALATASASCKSPGLSPGAGTDCPPSSSSVGAALRNTSLLLTVLGTATAYAATGVHAVSKLLRARCTGAMRRLSRTMNTAAAFLTGWRPASADATSRPTDFGAITADEGSPFALNGGPTGAPSCGTSSPCRAGTIRRSNSIEGTTTAAMSRATSGFSVRGTTCETVAASTSFKPGSTSLKRRLPTYDIAYCGPRNRFTIWTDAGPLITHNCGFGMGPGKFQDTAATYGVFLSAEESERYVLGWRRANARIVAFWYDIERLALKIAASPSGSSGRVGKVQMRKTGKALRVVLPSGSELTYQNIEIETDEFGGQSLSYMGVHPTRKRWERIRTYGGRLAENITQATARDVLADALVEIDSWGTSDSLAPVGSSHDELIVEADARNGPAGLAHVSRVMSQTPAWAPGLPMAAEGWIGSRYRK